MQIVKMSCEANQTLKERLYEEYYQSLIDDGLTREEALNKLEEMFYDNMC